MESLGATNVGFAPTSIDFAQRALASGLEPTIKWTWFVESTDVKSDGGIRPEYVIGIR